MIPARVGGLILQYLHLVLLNMMAAALPGDVPEGGEHREEEDHGALA